MIIVLPFILTGYGLSSLTASPCHKKPSSAKIPSVRSVWRMPEVSQPVGLTPTKSWNSFTHVRISSLLFCCEMNELDVLGIRVADDFMTPRVNRLHRLGITMNTKRIRIE